MARKVRLLRFLRHWSQQDLATISGLHRTYISSVERGYSNISLDNIERLAEAFNLPINELLHFSDVTGKDGELLEEDLPPDECEAPE